MEQIGRGGFWMVDIVGLEILMGFELGVFILFQIKHIDEMIGEDICVGG